ncbi:DWNN domain-containing protein [Annulohypoxylon maeteangense]|uniref:DWNN domain-containing protein n=1 Tax=Annulohypoxylon maeteangense TaxID=1927788 RepID=UPI002008D5D7|nr:DWNN domain-containing protein [Annulohypoxylon maeteangense]KAI0885546.1 DWNN domain-containing protein [Annulohypoxylon maeteangense]
MTSSVFFKFKSQKEPSRVEFDGTGISVFELKRDIIVKSGLGDGTDFDLAIYSEDGSEEYDDDTTIIPRSTTVVARRLPPQKPGAGRAARYVSGKMPASAKNSSRRENATKATKPTSAALTQMSAAMTEEEKMMAMFQAQSDQWTAQQEEMSHQTAVYKPGAKKPANVPDHDPPNGYICYRCGQKGHWIQVCPTNDNPEFDNRPRVKRTTGIPRSFLKTVDKSALQQTGTDGEEVKPPAGVMVNADGEFVIAEPDKASWEQYQAKTKSSAAAQKAASAEDRELEEKGLLCAIDKRMFIDPMKTPCCEKTYCNECITNALIESDFICPGCQTEGVLIDDLKTDDETTTKIQDYLKEKESTKTKERSKSPPAVKSPSEAPSTKEASQAESPKAQPAAPEKTTSPTPSTTAKSPPAEVAKQSSIATVPSSSSSETPKPQEATSASKKRSAEDPLENPKIPKGPKAMQRAQEAKDMQNMMQQGMNGMPSMMPNLMQFPMNGFGQPNMNMAMMMGMNPMMNPMMGMNGMFNPAFQGMNGNGMFGGNFGGMNGGAANNMNGMGMNGSGSGGFNNQNQQPHRPNFTTPNNDNDAYFRKPVNPGRHQNKQRRVRPSDYREL